MWDPIHVGPPKPGLGVSGKDWTHLNQGLEVVGKKRAQQKQGQTVSG